jgi:uncharacterized caspase-like protein
MAPAHTQDTLRGVALVIGQSEYEHIAPLPNPENDADAIDDLLSDLGFDVTGVSSADQKKLARALERFVEDAEDADVALIYYSGHGIEAGGENYLVPVDADLGALEDAGERLVPISRMLEALQATVPVTIVLLDACRDNPFPPGTLVRMEPGAAPVALAPAGLSAPRGASPLAAPVSAPTDQENYGALIGFAAAPGRVALDGDPGGNSPYASALIKHLSAGGYAFGDVMTMVAEEVWLKTRAAQTPWTNTSLRRELFFGEAAPEATDGDEAAIRGERRSLLLRIASLGPAERQQVAARAHEGGVPMDALFAMLAAVGAEAPQDPSELDALLKQQADRLRSILADRAALNSTDAELVRLASLADEAIGEGALQSAIDLNERAKKRVGELSSRVDDAEAEIARRRTEFAAVYAKSAQTYALAGDHGAAAADWHRAFEEVERWDVPLAWRYRAGEAEALASLGHFGGDNAALTRSVETWQAALPLAPRAERPVEWARTQAGLGGALWTRGDRLGDAADLTAAIAALQAALAELDRDSNPAEWSDAQSLLGAVLMTAGAKQTETAPLAAAEDALRAAAAVRTRETAPAEWARIQNRLGVAVMMRGLRDPDTTRIRQALALFEASLSERGRDAVPMDWAQSQNNRALALSTLGQRDGDAAALAAAAQAYRDVLEVQTRERTPILWAEGQANLGAVLWQLALREGGTDMAAESAAAFRLALEVVPREVSPLRWAALKDNLGLSLKTIGERRADEAMVEEAISNYREALEERRRDRVPLEWAGTTSNLAGALYALGYHRSDVPMITEAVALWEAAIEVNSRQSVPLEWARVTNNLGLALHALGTIATDAAALDRAADYFRLSSLENTRERVPVDWGLTQYNLARVLLDLGRHRADRAVLAQALEAALASREVYMAAGMQNFAGTFDNLELEIRIADLQADVDAKLKALQAGEAGPPKTP